MRGACLALILFAACGEEASTPDLAGVDLSYCYQQRGPTECTGATDLGGGWIHWYWIVCADNGVTYQYWELANCSCVPYHSGACDPEACSLGETGPPVCAQDGKTYAGDQTAGCHGQLKAHDGPCEGSDGGT